MKKTIIISLLLLMTASLVFSQNTFGQNFYGRQENHPRYGSGMVIEIVELSGKITVNEKTFPTFKAGKDELSLLIGQNVIETLKLKSGDSVKIKGFKVPGPNWSVDEKSALKVREMTVNGKTYQIMGRSMPGHMNGGPGMMNGGMYGRSNGMTYDHHRTAPGNYGTVRNK